MNVDKNVYKGHLYCSVFSYLKSLRGCSEAGRNGLKTLELMLMLPRSQLSWLLKSMTEEPRPAVFSKRMTVKV